MQACYVYEEPGTNLDGARLRVTRLWHRGGRSSSDAGPGADRSYELSGYDERDAFLARRPSWQPVGSRGRVDDAIAASQAWVSDHGHGAIVEVIEVNSGVGEVTYLVTVDRIEKTAVG